MSILQVRGLAKRYPGFALEDVSLRLEYGRIMGLIGVNGAGKTTTLKSILNLVRPDAGEIVMLGRPFPAEETLCKQELGVVLGGVGYYQHKRLGTITGVTQRFYRGWDAAAYNKYLREFGLDPNKKVNELSEGMKVKYSIALALSHNARLLVFDEPTSGLDPVSRDDLLGLFRELVREGTRGILYSTHITTDLERCADDITYLKEGRVAGSGEKEAFIDSFQHLRAAGERLRLSLEEIMIRNERRAYDV